jgi:LysR family glycine cleavage system transcriptional activator
MASIPLSALRTFEAAFRHGNFKSAAAELDVTPAAVSHQVKSLEAYLGAVLFDRLHRALLPTQAGEKLGGVCVEALSKIERTLDEMAEAGLITGGVSFRLSAPPVFAIKWLTPRLPGFQSAHPGIQLNLQMQDDFVDPGHDRNIHVVIRYGHGPFSPDLHAERLFPPGKIIAVCAPVLRDRFASPVDVLQGPLLNTTRTFGPKLPQDAGWTAWFTANGVSGDQVKGDGMNGW